MKVLTLTQPWATLVAIGAKQIETRSWATSYRGPLAIHAAKGLGPVGGMRGLIDLCEREPFWGVLREALRVSVLRPGDAETIANELPRGEIIAVCELALVVPTGLFEPEGRWMQFRGDGSRPVWRLTDQERAFGDYTPGRFAWLLADIRPLPEPIPAKGALGLWEPDAGTLTAIRTQLIESEVIV